MLVFTEKESKVRTAADVDQYISARIPRLVRLEDFSEEANQERRLWQTVTTSMLHDCNEMCTLIIPTSKGPIMKCTKHFPKDYTPQTIISGLDFFLIKLYFFSFRNHILNVCSAGRIWCESSTFS